MGKIFYYTKLLILFIFFSFALHVATKLVRNPTMIRPYPYRLIHKLEIPKEVENAHVLIVGDQNALHFYPWVKDLVEKLSQRTRDDVRVVLWANKNEGTHRIIHRLKNLKKTPPVIVYMGGSSEFYEKKFRLKDKKTIDKNFERYQNEKLISLILALPTLSRLIYKPPHYQILNELVKNPLEYSAHHKQMQMEITYKIFPLEMTQLIHMIKGRNKELIIVSPPININRPPERICENSQTPSTKKEHEHIRQLLKEQKYKLAYGKLKNLSEVTLANAESFYLLGLAAKHMGHFKEAKESFYKASAFDCEQNHPNIIFNNLLEAMSKENDLSFIDFNRMVNDNLGPNILFKADGTPQDIYYDQLMNRLAKLIKAILQL